MERVLIVDDDIHIAELIDLYITKEGFDTKVVYDGYEAVKEADSFKPHLILLDIMLPGIDGYKALAQIRKKSNVPVIMITAKGETFDKVLGLELGADDYIVKPFEPKEMVARVKAVLRRYSVGTKKGNCIEFDNIVIDYDSYEVIYHGEKIDMPPKEFELLGMIASSPNKVFTRDMLLDRIWGYEYAGDTRTVDVHIKRIREKLDKEDSWNIRTIYGVGYKFEV